jgi:hypothetical protein
MGLLGRLVLLPLAPVEGLLWLGRTIQEVAEQELYDPARLRAQLAGAEDAYHRGELTDQELAAIEDALLARLMQAGVADQGAAGG